MNIKLNSGICVLAVTDHLLKINLFNDKNRGTIIKSLVGISFTYIDAIKVIKFLNHIKNR